MKMKLKTKIEKLGRGLWQWSVIQGHEILGSGYCATRADATNDGGIFARTKAA
jgi:hypothetical protein